MVNVGHRLDFPAVVSGVILCVESHAQGWPWHWASSFPVLQRVEACLTAALHFSHSLAIMTISLSRHPRRWEESHECFCRRLCWSQQVLKVNKTFRGRNFLIKLLHHPLIAFIFPLHIFSLSLHPLDSFGSKIKWSQQFLQVIKLELVICLASFMSMSAPESHLEVALFLQPCCHGFPWSSFYQPSKCVMMTNHLENVAFVILPSPMS